MKRIGRIGLPDGPGQLDKVLLIALGLLAVVVVRWVAPEVGDRMPTMAAVATATPRPAAPPGPAAVPAPPPPEPSPTPEPARAALPDPPYWRISSGGSGVNMRAEPSTAAPVKLRLADNEVVTNLDKREQAGGLDWRNVALGDIDGWVAADLLVPQYD